MESVEEQVTQYRIPCVVDNVYQHAQCTGGFKNDSGQQVLTYAEAKWYVHLQGSTESLCFGIEKPVLAIGDPVDIIIIRKRKP